MNPQISSRILAFLLLMLAFACSAPKDASVEIVTIGDVKVPKIHIDKIIDKAVVKFSDWVEDVRLIHLETNDKCLIQYAMRVYLGKEYILISTIDKGILKFDQNGKFLSNLVPHGKGPGEVMDANRNIFVDEKNDMLYLTDIMMRHQIHSYNIQTGKYKEIPIMHKGPEVGVRDIIVRNDSLMYMTLMQVRKGKSDCPLFCQTTSGKLLWEIKKTNPLGLTDATIHLVNDKIYLYYGFGQDTTWVLDNQQLKPVSIITSVMPNAYFEEKVGNGYIGLAPVTDRISLGRSSMIESMAYDAESRTNQSDYSDRVFPRS